MSRRLVALPTAALLLAAAPLAASVVGHFNGYTTLSQSSGTLTSATDVSFVLDTIVCDGPATYEMYGDHLIQESNGGGTVAAMQWGINSLHYHATLYGSASQGSCYSAVDDGAAYLSTCDSAFGSPPFLPYYMGSDGPWRSSSACYPAPPPPPDPPPGDTPDQNGGNTDWSGTGSPVVLNLGNGSYQTSGLDDPVAFDITGDGRRDVLGWTARGSALAFVALDRNANGAIDDGRELFGDATPRPDGTRAANGFQALKDFDANGDGVLDARDPIWQQLLLWLDANHDAATGPGELTPMAASAVVAIQLDYHASGRQDPNGYEALTTMTTASATVHRTCYDIFFVLGR